jgi:Holliday junction resolvase RusA-like endonuclease
MIELTISTIPKPWAAPRISKWGSFDTRAKDKNVAKWLIKEQYRGYPIQGYVFLDFTFIFPVPLSTSKKKKLEMLAGNILPTGCDCTNLQKMYEDCVKGVVITDDRNVVKISSRKLYGEKGAIIIRVFPWEQVKNDAFFNR